MKYYGSIQNNADVINKGYADQHYAEKNKLNNIENGEGKNSLQQINNLALGENSFAEGNKSVSISKRAIFNCDCTFVSFDKINNILTFNLSNDITYDQIVKFKSFFIKTTSDKWRSDIVNIKSEITGLHNTSSYACEIDTPLSELQLDTRTAEQVKLEIIIEDSTNTAWTMHSEGDGSYAIGDISHAEGRKTLSADEYTHTEGWGTIALGRASHAEGWDTKTLDNYSHAEGGHTVADYGAHAEGIETKAGRYSHSEGWTTIASGQGSHAEGYYTEASGTYSHSEGHGDAINGYTIASGEGAHAEGFITKAAGRFSHTEGQDTVATGECQHVQGKYNYLEQTGTDADGNPIYSAGGYAHVVGNGSKNNRSNAHTLDWNGNAWFAGNVTVGQGKEQLVTNTTFNQALNNKITKSSFPLENGAGVSSMQQKGTSSSAPTPSKASGSYSAALGLGTKASGTVGFAEGFLTQAQGHYSHSEGQQTIAQGSCSHAEGRNTIATSTYQHVQGKYNLVKKTGTDSNGNPIYETDNYLHVVGNGTSDTARSNAHTIDTSGNAWFKGDVLVGGTGQSDGKRLVTEDDIKELGASRVDVDLTKCIKNPYNLKVSKNKINFTHYRSEDIILDVSGDVELEMYSNSMSWVIINGTQYSLNEGEIFTFKGYVDTPITINLADLIFDKNNEFVFNKFTTNNLNYGLNTKLLSYQTTEKIEDIFFEDVDLTTCVEAPTGIEVTSNSLAYYSSYSQSGFIQIQGYVKIEIEMSKGSVDDAELIINGQVYHIPHYFGGPGPFTYEGYIENDIGFTLWSSAHLIFNKFKVYNTNEEINTLNEKVNGLLEDVDLREHLTITGGKADITENTVTPLEGDTEYGSHIKGIIDINGYCEIEVENTGIDIVSLVINGIYYEAWPATGTTISFKGAVAEPILYSADIAAITKFTRFVTLNSSSNKLENGTGENSLQQKGNLASGDYSFAEGCDTKALGEFSHSEGFQSQASAYGSHAEGQAHANGHYSHAEGYKTEASGMYSHAEGAHTKANINFSHTEGIDSGTHHFGYKVTSITDNRIYFNYTIINEETGVEQETNLVADGVLKGMILSLFNGKVYNKRYTGKIEKVYSDSVTLVEDAATAELLSNLVVGDIVLINNGYYGNVIYKVYITDDNGERKEAEGHVAAHAEGLNSHAYIDGHAEGVQSVAIGYASHAEGCLTQAVSDYSHSGGIGTIANGDWPQTVVGSYNAEDKDALFIVGHGRYDSNNNLKRSNAFTIKEYNAIQQGFEKNLETPPTISGNPILPKWLNGLTNGDDSNVVITNSSKQAISGAFGDNSVSLNGKSQAAGGKSFAAGSKTIALGNNAFATGNGTFAAGQHSFTQGDETSATGNASHAEGYQTEAQGKRAHAEGLSTQAKGEQSHAEGDNTKAIGVSSHAEGSWTIALGPQSHAEGVETWVAQGANGAHASGGHTVANGGYSFVSGVWNEIDEGNFPGMNSPTADGKRQYAVIVGNGTDENNRSNAMTVDWDGNAWFAGDIKFGQDNISIKDKVNTYSKEEVDNLLIEKANAINQLSEEKADKEFVVSIFEQLKALIEAGKTDEVIAVLDEAIFDLAVLA